MTSPHLPKVAGIQPTVSSDPSTDSPSAPAADPSPDPSAGTADRAESARPSPSAASSASTDSSASSDPPAPPESPEPGPGTATADATEPGTPRPGAPRSAAPKPPSARAAHSPTGSAPEGTPADRRRIRDLSSLLDLTTRLARTDCLDTALRETLRAGAALLGAPRGLVVLEPGTHPGTTPGLVPERTIGLGLGRADLGELETVPCPTVGPDPTAPAPAPGTTPRPAPTPPPAATTTTAAPGPGPGTNGGPGPGPGLGTGPAPGAEPPGGIACPDVAADQRLSSRHREVAARLGYAATYAVPLTTESGTRLGAAVWLYDEPGEPTPRQRELLGSYLRHATEHCARLGDLARTRAESATLSEELLPSALPHLPGVTLAVRHRTGPSGGGDWYDALPLPDRAVGLAVGGVTGSGPSAVAAMGRLRASLRAYAVMEGEDPVAVLSDLELLLRLTEPAGSATALFAYAEPATRKVLLAGAGHCAPLIVGPRRIEPVETAVSAPLGMLACWEAPSAEIVLGEGETLLCYTDGLLHRTGHSMDRAFARLRSAAAGAPRATREDPEALVDHVLRTVLPEPLADLPDHPEDVVLLAARF
ncbi:serine/threonine-protein phosphatase [Streptomyces albus subsp. chlorinus]|uniref:PP2C family protein-serine/threonine phosphatase n=1 Tax=Streptomyces albus TaxID=1888 RepID=UPI001570DBAD|nr:PP2C family protein-serine/threonine phosphatase [Streptomyces albus]NSC22626.1 serine/threonine-protein phosphatase [Streptomyces albus subsp. chlorinus]